MKTLKRISNSILKAMCLAALACPMAVSCTETIIEEHYYENNYDDTDIWNSINILIGQIYDLEQKMNSEIKTLQDLLKGKIFITDISTDTTSGVTVVTLSNGETLALFPEKSMKSFVTYLTLSDGISYWAYIDADGKKQLFLNEDGEAIPVISETPEVVVKDGDSYLVIGGVEYPLSGNSVFSDYEVIRDELTGEIYAVTFTFGDDMSFTVTVDGAAGFHFVQSSGWSSVMISDYYVPVGATERIQIEAKGVVDYVLQIPDGWRVKEYEDPYMGTKYFDVTAPSPELIKSGVAASEGDLKVVAVLEGGKATVAKLYLSTEPFKEFSVSLLGADVKMYSGLQKYVYGICPASDYDESVLLEVAEGLLTAYDYPAGYGVATYDFENVSLEEIAGQELVPGQQYVFWAIPALYYQTADDAGYYVKEGTFSSKVFNYASVNFVIGRESFRDAELMMDVKGVEAYYTAVTYKSDFYLEDVVYYLNNGFYDKVSSPMSYTGSVFTFAGVEPEPSTEYVAWIAVAENGKTYTESDIIVREFSTLNLTAGSSVKVKADKVDASALEIVTHLSASGAESIYYTYLTPTNAKKYTDDQARANYLFESGMYAGASSVQAKASEVISKMKPEMDLVLFAVATDSQGKYGDVLVLDCKTTSLQYNDLVVEISLAHNEPDDVQLNISTKGGQVTDYLYWVGKVSENTWKSPNYLGGSAETAQVYMYLNPNNSRFTEVKTKYPVENGLIKMTDLAYGENYVFVAMAKDVSGLYSKATEFRFTPRAVGIGTVVTSSDPQWEEARPVVTYYPEKSYASSGQMSGSLTFDIVIPTGFTGYVLAGTDSYLNDGDDTKELTIDEKIIKIIQYVDKPRDSSVTVDYDLWEQKGWPYGYQFYHHHHGNPMFGNVTIWASEEYHDGFCTCGGAYVEMREINGVQVEVEHVININDGTPVEIRQPYAVGSTTEVVDKVFVVCQDMNGNCYETFVFDVPVEVFSKVGRE